MNEPSIHTGLPAGTVLSLQPDEQPGAPCRFRLEGGLGQGGSAWVYRALRLGQNAQVGGTLKILALAGQPQMDRLRQVCTALHRLKRQEGLSVFIPYMDLYRDQDGHPCLFTPEDRQGVTLDQYLRQLGPDPSLEELCQVLAAVCATALAVWQLNRQGALLLDIKPDNILLIRRQTPCGGAAYLQDSVSLFDIDSLLEGDPALADRAWLLCSPGFTAPELGGLWSEPRRHAIGPASDVYALGATLFWALTGQVYPPSNGDMATALRGGRFGPLLCPDTAEQLASLLESALAYSPSHRLADCASFARRLDRALGGLRRQAARESGRERLELARSLPRMLAHLLYRWPCHEYARDGLVRVAVVSDGDEGAVLTALDTLVKSCQVLNAALQITVAMPGAEKTVRGWQGKFKDGGPLVEVGPGPGWGPRDWQGKAARVFWVEEDPAQASPEDLCAGLGADYWLLLMGDPDRAGDLADAWPRGDAPALVAWAVPQGKTLYAQVAGPLKKIRLCPGAVDDVFTEEAERMAYCTHLLYERERDPDVGEDTVRHNFAQGYNRQASLESALAIKCRLFSAGVPWAGGAQAMAAAYRQALEQRPELVRELSWLEHRRWMLSKLVQGARRLPEEDYPLLLDGGAQRAGSHLRRDGRLYHAYLVPSAFAPRPQGWQTAQQWAGHPLDEPLPDGLDPLDRAGVQLYRLYAGAVGQAGLSDGMGLLDRRVKGLCAWLEARGHAGRAGELQGLTRELAGALEGLQSGTGPGRGVSRFESARLGLGNALEALEGKAPGICQCRCALEMLQADTFCLVQWRRCTDPKQLDETMVRNLPRVLGGPQDGRAQAR